MTARDRSVILVVGALAMLGAFWFFALAPKRHAAQALNAQVAAETQRLEAAKQSAASAAAARARYARDYATVARLGKAVPVDDEVPSLLYQLETAAAKTRVDFRSMKLDNTTGKAAPAAPAAAAVASTKEQTPGGDAGAKKPDASATPAATPAAGAPGAAPATGAVAAALPPGAAIGPAGFPTMPFSFGFDGTFFGMERFLRELNRFTQTGADRIDVRGRLLTIDSVSLVAGRKGYPRVSASISATAYLLPAEQGLTAGATPTAPGTTPAGTTAAPAAGAAAPAAAPGNAAPTPAATATGAKP